jgi:hypothetical protein
VVFGVDPELAEAGIRLAATAGAAIDDDIRRAFQEGELRPWLRDETEPD